MITSELKGNLADTQLDSLLTLLGTTRKTGILRIRYPDKVRNTKYAFRRGKIGRVKTSFAPKLTEIMIDRGAAESHILALRQSQKSSREQAGATMISESSGIDYGIVIQALKRRLEMSLVPLLLYSTEEATFEFKAEAENDSLDSIFIEPGIEADHLTLDVTRKVDELRNYSPLASTLDIYDRFAVSEDHAGLAIHMQTFSHYEWKVLTTLFTPKSLLEAAVASKLVWYELLRSITSLLERELIVHVPD